MAKKLSFADPYACAIFQLERMEDLGEAQNFRVEMAKHRCSEKTAREKAKENIFSKTVVFGLGMTGLFIADQIRRNHPDAEILFVGRSDENCKKVVFSKEKSLKQFLCLRPNVSVRVPLQPPCRGNRKDSMLCSKRFSVVSMGTLQKSFDG